MSDQSTILREESPDEDRRRLTELVRSLGPKAKKQDVREAGYKIGFGPIGKALLKEVWDETRPPKRNARGNSDFSKYPLVQTSPGMLPVCPHCQTTRSRVYTIHWLDDENAVRQRICQGCKGKFYSAEVRSDIRTKRHDRRRDVARNLTEKQCTLCGLILPIAAFSKKDQIYYQPRCRDCKNVERAKIQLRTKLKEFGLTPEQYQVTLESQDSVCAICGQSNLFKRHSHGVGKNPLCFDHCHKTGKFRGLLCHRCNRAIGLFGDSVDYMEKALVYLKAGQPAEETPIAS